MNKNHGRLCCNSEILPTITFVVVSDSHLNSVAADDDSFPNLDSPPMFFYTARKKIEIVKNAVNNLKPDLVIHLGDTIHGPNSEDSFDMFMQYWSAINPNVKTSITAGNHDYYIDDELGTSLHEYVADKLGYGNRQLTAGSKFNESYSISRGEFSVRFVNFDTNFDSNGQHSINGGFIPNDEISWISSELLACEDDVAIVYTHRGGIYLNETDKNKFESMLASVALQKPLMKIIFMYGHTHVSLLTEGITKIGYFPTYNSSALVDNIMSEYYVFRVNKNGIKSVQTFLAKY